MTTFKLYPTPEAASKLTIAYTLNRNAAKERGLRPPSFSAWLAETLMRGLTGCPRCEDTHEGGGA